MKDSGTHYNTDPPELVELCTNCPEEDCPTGNCGRRRALAAQLRKRGAKPPAIMIEREVKPADSADRRASLARYNAAIDALQALAEEEDLDCNAAGKVAELESALRSRRMAQFEEMIDWHTIAGTDTRNTVEEE